MKATAARRSRALVCGAALMLGAVPALGGATAAAASAPASASSGEGGPGVAVGAAGISPGTSVPPTFSGGRGDAVAGGAASPVPPTAQTATAVSGGGNDPAATGAAGGAGAGPGAVEGAEGGASDGGTTDDLFHDRRVIVTKDAVAARSDHALVVGAWGIEVRPVSTTLPVFSRRLTTGCPLAPAASTRTVVGAPPAVPDTSTLPPVAPATSSADCPPVPISMLGVRHWVTHNLAWTLGAALALGGGRQNGRLLDTYFGFGPGAGLSLLLGNWRHLAVAASPSVALVWFKAAGSAPATYLADLRADLEGELYFGFIGVPALALGLRSGVLLRLEKAADVTLWSATVSGATSLKGLVSDLSLRYYF